MFGGVGGGQKGGICSEGFLSFCKGRGRQSRFWCSFMHYSGIKVNEVNWSRIYNADKYTKSDSYGS